MSDLHTMAEQFRNNKKVISDGLRLCCGQPPRLISGPGIGYLLCCMECGRGMMDNAQNTYQSAAARWDKYIDDSSEVLDGIPLLILKELNAANDVLRSLAFSLSVGGYNSTNVNAEVFDKKIHEGINMLTDPLLAMIDAKNLRIKELEESLGKVPKKFILPPEVDAWPADYVGLTVSAYGMKYTMEVDGVLQVDDVIGLGRHNRKVKEHLVDDRVR